jgi:thiamine pyrophosphate-dependent acetolactate synthase large subunit-like protein
MESVRAVKILGEKLTDELVVTSLGNPTHLLHHANDRPLNMYLRGAMGMASSLALGLAIARPDRKVVVLDGDGAALMNLPGMVTVGWQAPPNLVWVILENKTFLETGGQPIATSDTADLVAMATGCGIPHAAAAASEPELDKLLDEALSTPGPTLIVAQVDKDSVRSDVPKEPVSIKNRFLAALA